MKERSDQCRSIVREKQKRASCLNHCKIKGTSAVTEDVSRVNVQQETP